MRRKSKYCRVGLVPQLVQHLADVLVDAIQHGCIDFHTRGFGLFLHIAERVPVAGLRLSNWRALGIDETHVHLSLVATFLNRLVAIIVDAFVFGDVFGPSV